MIENLETIKGKLTELLSFANVTKEEIDSLFKVATSKDCESLSITWRKFPQVVKFEVGIVWEEQFHRKSKLLIVKAKTEKTKIHKGLEHTEGKFQTFKIELKQ